MPPRRAGLAGATVAIAMCASKNPAAGRLQPPEDPSLTCSHPLPVDGATIAEAGQTRKLNVGPNTFR